LKYKGKIAILKKFNRALRIINRVFNPENVRKHTRLSAHKTLARPLLTYGCEAWTIRKQDEERLATAEMKFMRRTCSLLDIMRNKHILDKMKVTPITEYVNKYIQNLLQHVNRMDRAKQMFRYAPIGRLLSGRPKRRWLETVTGHWA
jgi:hypothetical protein